MDMLLKHAVLIQLRTKKIGILLKDARLFARFEPEECAAALGITVEQYLSYEDGKNAPSLPEIETLAYILNVPMQHFWGSKSLAGAGQSKPDFQRLLPLRNRIVQTRLRQLLQNGDLDHQQIAEKAGSDRQALQKMLSENASVSLPELELICSALDMRVEDLWDQKGPVGEWHRRRQSIDKFDRLSPDLQDFVSKPVNHPFIDLAQRLSTLSVEKLRSIAESLLEITY